MRQRMMIALVGLALAAFSAKADNYPITPVGGKSPVVVNGSGSCSTCASAAQVHNRHFPGTVSPVGCSCYAAERTFFWGGCKQFFNPQKTCTYGCGNGGCGGGRDRERCPPPPIGPGLGAPANNCAGTFSYLNR